MNILWQRNYEPSNPEKYRFGIIYDWSLGNFKENTKFNAIHFLIKIEE